jgi:hypothetical protein
VGFMLGTPPAYRYFLLDQIPTQAELDQMGFEATHARPIVGLEIDPRELTQ